MKRNVLYGFTLAATLFLSQFSFSQSDQFAYAVTDINQSGAGWNALRKLNLKTGQYSDIVLNGLVQNNAIYDAATKRPINTSNDLKTGNSLSIPFNTGVAAIAYDNRNNRVYFTPMFIDQLRYIDLNTMKLYYVTNQAFTNLGSMHSDDGKSVSRMVITPDGNGYAITNDGNTFIHFYTAGKGIKIETLGALIDDPSNQYISIHNRCGGFGGDMIADDNGNLFIVSGQNHVFKVNTDTRVATHLGSVSGLPADFTTNGVAVDDRNMLILGSAVASKSWYAVDPATWKAVPIATPGGVYKSSDLANSNLLKTKNIGYAAVEPTGRLDLPTQSKVQVFPNPVSDNVFKIQFTQLAEGDYHLELTDIMGRIALQKKINVAGDQQTEKININPVWARGIYLITLRDQSSKEVFTQKIVVQ
ncbi:MAG: T9SS type A sorting domain-containing protein [Chitinophagaceae bacterium]